MCRSSSATTPRRSRTSLPASSATHTHSATPSSAAAHAQPSLLNGRWRIGRRLAVGTFGAVHVAEDVQTGRSCVMKVDRTSTNTLSHEAFVYAKVGNAPGFARVFFSGLDFQQKPALILERLDLDLYALLARSSSHTLSIKLIIRVLIQLVTRLQTLHEAGFVHCVVHPGNIMLRHTQSSQSPEVFLVDLGGARSLFSARSGKHVLKKRQSTFESTLDFGSANALRMWTQSRRDDLHSLLYLAAYLANGRLPWHRRRFERATELVHVARFKERLDDRLLLHRFPNDVARFAAAVRQLRFSDVPDYSRLRRLLRRALRHVDTWNNDM